MRVGIGITTYKRPAHLKVCVDQIRKHTKEFDLFIYDDAKDRKGIAYGKNQCIYKLRDHDHIFLFDDDCFPISDEWVEFFTGSRVKYSSFMNETYEPRYFHDNLIGYDNSSGVLVYITKEVVEKVGYYNPAYGIYGFEHAGYSHRVWKAGLTRFKFQGLKDTDKHICALDFNGGGWGLDHKRSLPDDEREEEVRKNDKIYLQEVTGGQIYFAHTL